MVGCGEVCVCACEGCCVCVGGESPVRGVVLATLKKTEKRGLESSEAVSFIVNPHSVAFVSQDVRFNVFIA